MRGAPLLAFVALLALPHAAATFCIGGVCWADDQEPSAEPCEGGFHHITGVWVSAPLVMVYVLGEDHRCIRWWGESGGEGIRTGVVVDAYFVELRWYQHDAGPCEIGTDSSFHPFGVACPAAPPALPWGDLLP